MEKMNNLKRGIKNSKTSSLKKHEIIKLELKRFREIKQNYSANDTSAYNNKNNKSTSLINNAQKKTKNTSNLSHLLSPSKNKIKGIVLF